MLLIARFVIATLFIARAVLGQDSPEPEPSVRVVPVESPTLTAETGALLRVTPRIVRERMQELELVVELDRDFAAAENGLNEVRQLLLDASDLEQRDELLIEVVSQHAGLLLELGRFAEAARLVAELDGLVGREADSPGAAQQLRAYLAREVGAFQQRLAASKARPADDMTTAVEAALRDEDKQLLRELGTRAVPALASLLDAGPPKPNGWDPLTWLVVADARRAATEITRRLEAGTPLDPQRVVRALTSSEPIRADEAWIATAGRSPRFARAEWLPILAWLSSEEASYEHRGHMLQLLKVFVRRDALTPELVDALATRLQGDNARITNDLLELVGYAFGGPENAYRVASHRALWTRVIGADSDAVRLMAAQHLLAWEEPAELLARARDPDPRVRRVVAQALASRDVREVYFKTKNGKGTFSASNRTQLIVQRLDDNERHLLTYLAADEDTAVRLAAVEAVVESVTAGTQPLGREVYLKLANDTDVSVRTGMIALRHPDPQVQREVFARLADDADPLVRLALTQRGLPDDGVRAAVLQRLLVDQDAAVRQGATEMLAAEGPPAEPAVYRRLLADPDPLVRRQLAFVEHVDEPLLQEILVTLAQDPDGIVNEAVDNRIGRELESKSWDALETWDAHETSMLAAARERRMGSRPSPWNQESWYVTSLGRRPAGRLELTRWALATGDDEAWKLALTGFDTEWHLSAWKALDDVELRELVGAMQRLDMLNGTALNELFVTEGQRPELAKQLLWDESTSQNLRLLMAVALAPGFDEAAVDRLAELLTTFAWSEPRNGWVDWATVDEGRPLVNLASRLSRQVRGRFRLVLVSDRSVPEFVALTAVSFGFEPGAPGGEELIAAILDRWYDSDEEGSGIVRTAISSLHLYPDSLDRQFLVEALETKYASSALKSLAVLRDPELLDDIASSLTSTSYDQTPGAVQAIVAYMSDDAAQVLLDVAATAPESWRREACMVGVREILEYQDARQAWEQRLSRRQTREATIGRLVILLADSEPRVRVEAVRGLASLDALDQLPAIIGLLADDEPDVRAAAQAALDRLNQPAEQH